jgi:putative addiction module antidote
MNKPTKPVEGGAPIPALTVRRIGNSVGIILPKELISRLRLVEGDTLHVVEQTEGGLKLSRHDALHEKGLAIARETMREYANTMRTLAR